MLRSQSVNSFDNDEDLANVEDNMFETLVSAEGVGVWVCWSVLIEFVWAATTLLRADVPCRHLELSRTMWPSVTTSQALLRMTLVWWRDSRWRW